MTATCVVEGILGLKKGRCDAMEVTDEEKEAAGGNLSVSLPAAENPFGDRDTAVSCFMIDLI